MTRFLKLLLIPLAALLVVGCQTTGQKMLADMAASENAELEKSGSPYRRVVENYGVMGTGGSGSYWVLIGSPAPTVADARLKTDVLAQIGKLERAKGRTDEPVLLKTTVLSKGATEVVEAWEIKGRPRNVAYKVSIKPSPAGGSDFSINGPW